MGQAGRQNTKKKSKWRRCELLRPRSPFKEGDYVTYKPHNKREKLDSKLLGPYQVVHAQGSDIRLKPLVAGRAERPAHPADLRQYHDDYPVAAAERNDDEVFTVERILSPGPKNGLTY